MNPVLRLILMIIGALFCVAGLLVVYLASRIVDKKGLAAKKKIDPRWTENLPEEEQEKARRNSAILDVKLIGLLISAPGFVIILIIFR